MELKAVTNQSLSIDKGPAGSLCAHNQLLVGQYFSLSRYRVKLKVHTRAHNHLLLVRSTPFTALSFHPPVRASHFMSNVVVLIKGPYICFSGHLAKGCPGKDALTLK